MLDIRNCLQLDSPTVLKIVENYLSDNLGYEIKPKSSEVWMHSKVTGKVVSDADFKITVDLILFKEPKI